MNQNFGHPKYLQSVKSLTQFQDIFLQGATLEEKLFEQADSIDSFIIAEINSKKISSLIETKNIAEKTNQNLQLQKYGMINLTVKDQINTEYVNKNTKVMVLVEEICSDDDDDDEDDEHEIK